VTQPLANLDFYCEVENEAFASRVSIASTVGVLKQAIRHDSAYKRLVNLLLTTKLASAAVAKRVALLSSQAIDPTYSNPFDAALSAYVLALQETSSSWLRSAAILALRAPQTWWSRTVCLEFLKSAPGAGESEPSHYFVSPPVLGAPLATVVSGDSRVQQTWAILGDVLSSILNATSPVSLFSISQPGDFEGDQNAIASSKSTNQENIFKITTGP
jgi:hypothetical protein